MSNLDVHADDYALTAQSDDDILELCRSGKINSLSIIPNLNAFDSAVEKFWLLENHKNIKLSVHLNFMEGKSLREKSLVPDLVDDEGFFTVTWTELLLWNFNLLKRKKIIAQLKSEIREQIMKCAASGVADLRSLRIDSHQHTHMIPVVYSAVLEVVKENNWNIEFIRNSYDPVSVYVKHIFQIKGLSFSNLMKCLVLNLFSIRFRRMLKRNNVPSSVLCGVFFSGKMDSRVFSVIEDFKKFGLKKKLQVELLFHPGRAKMEELTQEFNRPSFNKFHISENRRIEAETILSGMETFL